MNTFRYPLSPSSFIFYHTHTLSLSNHTRRPPSSIILPIRSQYNYQPCWHEDRMWGKLIIPIINRSMSLFTYHYHWNVSIDHIDTINFRRITHIMMAQWSAEEKWWIPPCIALEDHKKWLLPLLSPEQGNNPREIQVNKIFSTTFSLKMLHSRGAPLCWLPLSHYIEEVLYMS